MAREKQHVFSARTTEEGLGLLNKLKADLGVGWDELVVDAICAHYGLDRSALALPKVEKTHRVETKTKTKAKAKAKPKQERQPKAEKAEKGAKAKAKVAGKLEVAPEQTIKVEVPEQVAVS